MITWKLNDQTPLWKRVVIVGTTAIVVQGIVIGARLLEVRLGVGPAGKR